MATIAILLFELALTSKILSH